MKARLPAAAIVVVGLMLAATNAKAHGAGNGDTAFVLALSALGSLAAAVAGDIGSRVVRRRSLRAQLTLIGLVATATTAAGVLVAARFMFIAEHDIAVLGIVAIVSCAVSMGAALRLATSFEADTARALQLAQQLVDPAAPLMGGRHALGPNQSNEMVRLSRELQEVSVRLEASRFRERALDASRREIVAWVSHDLRSPIATVRALAEALEDAVVDDQESVARYHRVIRQQTVRLGELVDDLFDLSRITAGALAPDETMLPLTRLLREAIDNATVPAAERDVTILTIDHREGEVCVPAAHLRRALHNVLDNAIRHTPEQGTVTIACEVIDGVVTIDVIDECGGIPNDDLPRVFDVAFRGDVARGRDSAGGGLGLAIARGLMEINAGTIDVDNRGTGCRFTLRVPIAATASVF